MVVYEDCFIEFIKEYEDKKVIFVVLNCNLVSEDLDVMC